MAAVTVYCIVYCIYINLSGHINDLCSFFHEIMINTNMY